MHILHITEDFSQDSGGLRTVIKDLNQRLNKVDGISSTVLSVKKEEGDSIEVLEKGKNNPWLYSKDWINKLTIIVKSKGINIFHIHGVWMYPQFIAARFAKRNNIPFLLSCHGMYEPWLWKKGSFKKKIYFHLLSKPVFSNAKYIHAITKDEEEEIRKLIPKAETIEIPNLIDATLDYSHEYKPKEKYILFLGRLDPKKGIDLVIKAFANLNNNDLKLKIAGKFNDYKNTLDCLVNDLGLNNKVEFLGMVTGSAKAKLFKNAFIFVAPSYSEVIGMVNLEAAILKTPVITTYQTGLNIGWNSNGGILINPNEKELTKALDSVTKWSLFERTENGKKLYNFVIKNYSWDNRFKDWISLYKSML